MRLRYGPVEYKVCPICEEEYEGSQCLTPGHAFNPERVDKVTHVRLILVNTNPPNYERKECYRCTKCPRHLYDISEDDIVTNARCDECNKPILGRKEIEEIWKEAETLLQKAKRIDKARRKLTVCSYCQKPVTPICWCPICRIDFDHLSCLPKVPLFLWVRVFNVPETREERQFQEWVDEEENDE